MRTHSLIPIILFLLASVASAQESPEPKEDISWLAAVAKPELDYEGLTHRWSADSSAVIFEGLIVHWHDSADAALSGHTIRKAINCLPQGELALPSGDSVSVHPLSARISEVRRIGPIGIYRMVLPIQDASGQPLAETPSGAVIITVTAGKLVDRKYSIEATRQTAVMLP